MNGHAWFHGRFAGRRQRGARHALALLSTCFAVLVLGLSLSTAQQDEAPQPPPSLSESPPFDRVTLIDGTTLYVEPVSPRPLPPPEAYKARPAPSTSRKKGQEPPKKENVVIDPETGKLVLMEETTREAVGEVAPDELVLKPLNADHLYKVKRSSIRDVAYYEDLMMAESRRLAKQADFLRGFEYLLRVRDRDPAWPGLRETADAVALAEGTKAMDDSDVDRGFRLLNELASRSPDLPGLNDQLARAYAGRITAALTRDAYDHARASLHEFETRIPNHPIARATRERLIAEARQSFEKAQTATDPPARLDLLTETLRIWPGLDEAAEPYRSAFESLPTLEVGVTDRPAEPGPFTRGPTDARIARLLYVPILADDSEEAFKGERLSQLAASVQVADLGRRWTINLREGPTWSEGVGPVLAVDVARSLADRAQASTPAYQARWGRMVQRIEVTDPRKLEVTLGRLPLRPGHWLQIPLGPARASRDGTLRTSAGALRLVGSGPFSLLNPRSDSTVPLEFQARDDQPTGSATPIRRLRELPTGDGLRAVEALKRGDLTLLEHVPARLLPALAGDPAIKVGQYDQPRLHLIAIDGRNPLLANRNLRRALADAIDRAGLLARLDPDATASQRGAVLDGPVPGESYAQAAGVEPIPFDPALARMLTAAARKEENASGVKLRFEYPALDEADLVAPLLADAWRAAGMQIELVRSAPAALERELRSGRRFDLAYRVLTCPDPVTDLGPALCPGYDAPDSMDPLSALASPRILELLLSLEQATEFPTARGLVQQIDRESRTELPVVPLWQLTDHYAWRDRLTGPAETATNLYDGIETWQISPWFARDPW